MDVPYSDEDLMLDYAAGDAGAFASLYSRYKGPVYRYLYRLSMNEAVAEELFQDVWLKLIKASATYRVSASFRSYIYTLAHNVFVDHYRKQRQRLSFDHQHATKDAGNVSLTSENPELILQMQECQDSFDKALLQLPHEQREIFLLKEETQMSLQEIADTVGINYEAAKSRLRYAVTKLRAALNENQL